MSDNPDLIEIGVDELAELLDGGEVEVIDIRRDHEWEGGRIPGARHIEINRLSEAAASLPRDRRLVFYCRHGDRAAMATEAFRGAGYDAVNLEGGIEAWAAAGHDLEPTGGEVRAPLPAT